MNKLLQKIWKWLCKNEMRRHCIYFFLFRENENERTYEELYRYMDYMDDPEGADPELKEFGMKIDKRIELNYKIKAIRTMFDSAVCLLGIWVVVCLALELEKWILGARDILMQVFASGFINGL